MASNEWVTVEIGFDGGQIMGARLDESSAEQLEVALDKEQEGSLIVMADDGRYTIALRRVVYLKRFTREARLGFSSG
jgi:hypothetical protein